MRSCTASRIRATMPLVIAALLSARKWSRPSRLRHRIDPDRGRAAAHQGRVGLERVRHRLERAAEIDQQPVAVVRLEQLVIGIDVVEGVEGHGARYEAQSFQRSGSRPQRGERRFRLSLNASSILDAVGDRLEPPHPLPEVGELEPGRGRGGAGGARRLARAPAGAAPASRPSPSARRGSAWRARPPGAASTVSQRARIAHRSPPSGPEAARSRARGCFPSRP